MKAKFRRTHKKEIKKLIDNICKDIKLRMDRGAEIIINTTYGQEIVPNTTPSLTRTYRPNGDDTITIGILGGLKRKRKKSK
jgi:hypothetical protein